jgi:phospholipid/cholesterol/gamma-HCH transport system substrate-binding protein
MKITKIPASRTGLFVIICFGLLVIGLFLIGDKQKLFSNTSTYYVKLKDVNGLKPGAQVIVSGINVGSVHSIDLPRKAGDSVLVAVKVVKDAQNLIHSDSKASVTTIGLVGDKTLAISIGSPNTPITPHGGYIQGEAQREFTSLIDTLGEVLNDLKMVTNDVNGIVANIRGGKGTLGKLLTDEDLYGNIKELVTTSSKSINSLTSTTTGIQKSVDEALGNISQTSSEFRKVGESINSGKGSLGKLLNDTTMYYRLSNVSQSIAGTIAELKDAMTKFSTAGGNTVEVTEALKHNFLVRDYFEDRGYWKADAAQRDINARIDSLQRLQITVDQKLKQLNRIP